MDEKGKIEMIVNTKSWHYKVYRSTYTSFGVNPPWNTNLCQYVRRTFFLSWFWYLLAGLLYLLFFGVITPLGFLIGNVPCRKEHYVDWLPGWGFRAYRGIEVGSVELLPWMVLAPILLLGLNSFWIYNAAVFGWHAPASWVFLFFETAILFVVAFFMFGAEVTHDTMAVIESWVSAKKQKICPLIKFSNDLPTDREP